MQTLWDFDNTLPMGYPLQDFSSYFQRLAQWKALEGLSGISICDPQVPVRPGDVHDLAARYQIHFRNQVTGNQYQPQGYITGLMSEAAGFRLNWLIGPWCLKIDPGAWTEEAPLPATKPEAYTFWYCTTKWDLKNGGGLKVMPSNDDPTTFGYLGGRRGVLVSPELPHALTPITGTQPYYCLYGQLTPAK